MLANLVFYVLLVSFIYAVIYTERDDETSLLHNHAATIFRGRTYPRLDQVSHHKKL